MRVGLLVLILSASCDRTLEIPLDGFTTDATRSTPDASGSDSAMNTSTSASASAAGTCAKGVAPVSMPVALNDAAAVQGPDGRIYVLRGEDEHLDTSQWTYEPSTGVWTRLPDLPTWEYIGVSAVSIGQTIYLLGDKLFAFDLATQTWSLKSPGPSGTYAAGPDGKIYATGYAYGDPLPTAPARYDPVTDLWLPLPRQAGLVDATTPVGAFLGDTFYVMADFGFGYDIATNEWKTLSAPSPSRNLAVGGALGDRLFVAGGDSPFGDAPDVLSSAALYDPATDSWTAAAPMPTPVAWGAGAMGCDGRFYVFGGSSNEQSRVALVQVYDPATDTWESSQ